MKKVHIISEETALLKKYVAELKNNELSLSSQTAKQFVESKGLDLTSAENLIKDMDADSFTHTLVKLTRGERGTTKSIRVAAWVKKFDLQAEKIPHSDLWEISCFATEVGMSGDDDFHEEEHHGVFDWFKHHFIIAGMIVIAVLVFLGTWIFTGDIFAAWIIVEIILEILMFFE